MSFACPRALLICPPPLHFRCHVQWCSRPSYNYQTTLTVYDDLFVGILYGIYIVLYVTSMHVLMSPPGFTSSRHRMFRSGLTTFMFALGTTALALQKALELQNIEFNVFYFADGGITRLMYILSDVICAWRAVVIWDSDRRVIAILLLFILATIVTKRRVFFKKHLVEGTGSVSVERFLALLIESGFLYCIPWILYAISAFGAIPDPGFTIIDYVLVFISGIYPTLIIILVAVQKSPVEHYSTHSTGMQFMNGPEPRPPRAGDMPRHVYTQVRNSDMQSLSSMVVTNTSEDEPVISGLWDENSRHRPVEVYRTRTY
ncbi:hypothetical protein EDB86DRAFT_3244655 [Lactarius hatsudake]|nr:hypothetical protein EDB86DRAFT_3244655 [Lactarius hatsudake]